MIQFLKDKDFEKIAHGFMVVSSINGEHSWLGTTDETVPKWVVKALDKAYTLGLEHCRQLHTTD